MITILLAFLASALCQFHGPTYQAKTGPQKLSQLTSAVTADTESLDWYTISEGELFLESMNTSFTTVADDMPYQGFLKLEERKKLIHTVGVIGNGKWVPIRNSNNYTGLFASGCSDVLIRFSAAKEPATTQGPGCLTPGIALKALRSGVASGNIFAMYSLMGQNSFNFFKHDLSNHPPDLGDWAPYPLQLLRSVFAKASAWPTMLGLSSFATFDKDGNAAPHPRFPFRLVFHPTAQLHTAFPDSYDGVFTSALMNTVKPGVLYQVYAQDSPYTSNLVQIATLELSTPLTTSHFGDRSLFMEHTNFESDLVYVPQWKTGADNIQHQQRATEGYNYPDLPW